jgi:hypothetical protein
MGRRKHDRDRVVDRPAAGGSPSADAPAAAGPRAFVVEEERLPDGRYVLYYGWAADAGAEPVAPAPSRRTARAPRTPAR